MNILEACLGEKRFAWIGSEFQPCLEKSVGEKYGRSISPEAASVFFVQLCLEWLSNEHTWSLWWWEMIRVNCFWTSDLPQKICWRKIWVINRSCICFLCPVKLIFTIKWTYLKLVLVRNILMELSSNVFFAIGGVVNDKHQPDVCICLAKLAELSALFLAAWRNFTKFCDVISWIFPCGVL